MTEKKWDEVKTLVVSAKRLRVVAIVATVISVIYLCLSIWLTNAYIEQGGKLKTIQDILDSGVVIETTTETTTETVTQDGGEGSGTNVYQGDNSTYGGDSE